MLPAIVLLLLVLLAVVSAGSAHLRTLDAARAGARAIALGETESTAVRTGQHLAGDDAQMVITRSPPWVTVSVTKSIGPTWFTGGTLSARAQASAWIEP